MIKSKQGEILTLIVAPSSQLQEAARYDALAGRVTECFFLNSHHRPTKANRWRYDSANFKPQSLKHIIAHCTGQYVAIPLYMRWKFIIPSVGGTTSSPFGSLREMLNKCIATQTTHSRCIAPQCSTCPSFVSSNVCERVFSSDKQRNRHTSPIKTLASDDTNLEVYLSFEKTGFQQWMGVKEAEL